MRKPFEGSFPISQVFGNKLMMKGDKDIEYDYYGQWNMEGHNGIDYACPSGTPIVAPHAGTVVEANFNQDYGNYVKIENGEEGSVLAHLDSIKVQIGFEVKEGDIIGISDNTGASTGPHLHWGYFRKPRNRQNGFDGYTDQTPYLYPQLVIPEIVDGNSYTAEQLKMMGVNADETTSPQTVKGKMFMLYDDKKGGRILRFVSLTPNEKAIPPITKTYTEEEYLTMKKERDEALAMLKTEHDNYLSVNDKYTAFVAIGYAEAKDVTSTLQEYDKKMDGVKIQLSQQLKQNSDLARILADKNTEDATVIEEGIALGHKVAELAGNLKKIGKEVGTKPENVWDMIEHIKNIKEMAVKAFRKGQEEYKRGVEAAKKKEEAKTEGSKVSGLNWLMEFLFGEEVTAK